MRSLTAITAENEKFSNLKKKRVDRVIGDKKKILAFIDDYCQLVLKHKMQFSFGFTDLSARDSVVFSEIAIEAYLNGLIIGQTYPNKELAKVAGGLECH